MSVFQIEEIITGWFDIIIHTDSKEIHFTNSDYLDNDAPAILLRQLNRLFSGSSSDVWLCWHDEPGAVIWNINNKEGILYMFIADAKKEAYHLSHKEDYSLSKEPLHKILTEFSIPLYTFAKEVYDEFYKYSYGDGLELYEREWMEFPVEEFKQLGKHLR